MPTPHGDATSQLREAACASSPCGVGIGSGASVYQRLNELLEAERFDEFVETRCAEFYAEKNGRPSLTPGFTFGRC